jgi:hypothetical protein
MVSNFHYVEIKKYFKLGIGLIHQNLINLKFGDFRIV